MKDYIKYFLIYALTIGSVVILLEGIETEFSRWWTIAWLAVISEIVLEKPISALWKGK